MDYKKKYTTVNNNIRYQVIICLVLMIIVTFCYCGLKAYIRRNFEICKDDFSWVFQIDDIVEKGDFIEITGWAFQLKKNAEAETYEIVLYEKETGKRYFSKMSYFIREDVNSYFECEYDYIMSGFKANIPLSKIDFNKTYQVLLRPIGRQIAYASDTFFLNGKKVFTDPEEFVELDVKDTEIEKIVMDGILRVYRPDKGMYVYQYDQKLYWIADTNFEFINDATYIQYHLNTTQILNLPTWRLKNNWFFDDKGFIFEEYEESYHLSEYRVAVADLPLDYSITEIWTGANYGQKWGWENHFRPWYEFDKE